MNPVMPQQPLQQFAQTMMGNQSAPLSNMTPFTQQSRQIQTPTMPQQQFSAAHHSIYEKLRGVLMNLHAQGIPGMDAVLNALNKAHVDNLKPPQSPTLPGGGR